MLRDFLDQLCVELEMVTPPIQDKKAALEIGKVEVTLGDLAPGISLRATIGPCPKERKEELFTQLMRANYLGQGTGGARIGLSPDELLLTLSLGLSYELSYRAFREKFEDFVNFVLYWREELEKFATMQRML